MCGLSEHAASLLNPPTTVSLLDSMPLASNRLLLWKMGDIVISAWPTLKSTLSRADGERDGEGHLSSDDPYKGPG